MTEAIRHKLNLNDEEVGSLFKLIRDEYGYDFKEYAKNSQTRHLNSFFRQAKFNNFEDFMRDLRVSKSLMVQLLDELTTSTTEIFRDPDFFLVFRKQIVPYLKTFPTFKIWHAGCSTGEEVFSMAILLKEAQLIEYAILYGTDINTRAIKSAKAGIVATTSLRKYAKNYFDAGGESSLHEYWITDHDYSILNSSLMKKIVFGEHNLVTDGSFGEVQVIVCRNVLIYFNRDLQDKVLNLLSSALSERGFLCLGPKETISSSSIVKDFEVVDRLNRIYRKKIRE